jgi:hypothetical protein
MPLHVNGACEMDGGGSGKQHGAARERYAPPLPFAPCPQLTSKQDKCVTNCDMWTVFSFYLFVYLSRVLLQSVM